MDDRVLGVDDILLKILAGCDAKDVTISWTELASSMLDYLRCFPRAAEIWQLQRLSPETHERYHQLLVEFTTLRARGFARWGSNGLVITREGRSKAASIEVPSELSLLADLIVRRIHNNGHD